MGILAGEEHRPIRAAHRIVADSIREDNAFRSEAVKVGSNNRVLIHKPYSLLAELVRDHEYKIRSFLCHKNQAAGIYKRETPPPSFLITLWLSQSKPVWNICRISEI